MEILWKGTASAEFRAICPELYGNRVFPQNFQTRKLGEVSVFYAVLVAMTLRRYLPTSLR